MVASPIVCDANGLAVFNLLRPRWHCDDVILCAFHLLELDGHHMRRAPLEERKAAQAKLLRRPSDDIGLNEHYTGDGAIIFKHSCALGCEGIVSKRLARRTAPAAPTAGSRSRILIRLRSRGSYSIRRDGVTSRDGVG
jgi:ATP-dependent DNA ligase